MSYSSDQPLIAYASVVDNGTSDPTFVAMAEDTGGSGSTSNAKSASIALRDWAIDITPVPSGSTAINVGDVVTLTIRNTDPTGRIPHGLELDDPSGQRVFSIASIAPGQTFTQTVTFSAQGTYNYYCTQSSCGTGANQHSAMFGQIIVGQPSDTTRPGY